MRTKKLIILGCGGFVGSHLTNRLLSTGRYRIEGWDISHHKISAHLGNDKLRFHRTYLDAATTFRELEPHLEECAAVVSLAAVCTPAEYVLNPVHTIRSNFIDAYRLVELCAKYRKWLIHTSTSEVYGRTIASYLPGNAYSDPDLYEQREDQTPMIMGPSLNHRWCYSTAKQLLERYVLAHHKENDLPFTIVRPYNWFGPRMDFIPGRDGDGIPRVLACFMKALLDHEPMQLVDGGTAYRTITYIEDAIDCLQAMIEQPDAAQNQIFNLGNPNGEITVRGLAELMREVAADVTNRREYLEHPIVEVASEVFYGVGYEDCDRRVPNMSKAQTLLGWRAKTNLRDTLRATMAHYFDTYARAAA
jgi:UDP-apiose/xylose synthase